MNGDTSLRTVVVKPCCIGDCVMALPAIDALARAADSGKVDVFCGQHSMAVFQDRKTIAAVRPCPERFTALTAVRFGSSDLRKARAQRLVALDRSRGLRVASTLAGADNRHAIVANEDERRHESEVYLDLVRSIGVETGSEVPRITPDSGSNQHAARLVDRDVEYVVVHPGGGQNPGAVMHEKRWPLERFAELARWFSSRSLKVYVSGSASERELCGHLASLASLGQDSVLAGRSDLMTTAAIVAGSRLYIGGDTGVSHIAAAVGSAVVAIFGPTNPRRYRPIGERVRVLCPLESWEIGDSDLRVPSTRRLDVSIQRVSTSQVIEACNDLLTEHSRETSVT